ncbi:MAG: hypothetical protein EA396_08975 [Anaerolineaceae bacterium]|nr:MAG: hypothetical protein EA396_08975 [Anaerolineaceae bacterium]
MGWLTAQIFKRLSNWERPAQIGFFMALVVLLPLLVVAVSAADSGIRAAAALSAVAVMMVMQGIFLWANRNMVTPFAAAQRAYRAGEFEQALAILEKLRADGKRDVSALTLLGNTYRQVGQLEKSAAILSECLNIYPTHYFPLYGFGRTLLAQGHYARAAENIHAALENGAPAVVRFDLAESHYRSGDTEAARRLLLAVRPELDDEPHRALMADYLLHQLAERPAPDVSADALAFWRTQAHLFRDTPYGQAVADDVNAMTGA